MNYQHAYHAGTVADVFKHIVLIQLLKTLDHKPTAFCYVETHTGKALYDLNAAPAQKTLEYKTGIEFLYHAKNIVHPAIIEYLNIVGLFNPHEALNFYPGSSLIARQYLRESDKAILCELHPEIYQELHHYYQSDKKMHVHPRNGYEALAALVPPKEKRGVVLIDPPYEMQDEYQQIINTLEKAQKRWPTGIYAIWFPIKQYEIILKFYHSLKQLQFSKILTAEFWTQPDDRDNRLKGSGLLIFNPPWKLDQQLTDLLPALAKGLNTNGPSQVFFIKE